ncbi:MAG: O-antigen ligase family protein [Planctomycetes bacterium]|nr:O-antigen ligase family protein [Planctomycetota bacterium]
MNAVIFIAVVVGLVWGTVFVARGSLVHGCLAFLVVGYCLGHELFRFDLGPFPLTLERLVLGGLVFAYVVHRRLGKTDPKPIAREDVALLAFAGLLIASTLTHDWRAAEPGKTSPLWLLVAGYLMPVVVYWIGRQSRLNQRTLVTVYGCLAVLGIYLTVTALAEVTQQWWLVLPPQMKDPDAGIHFGRARGPTLQSHNLGVFLTVCLLAVWAWRPSLRRVGQLALIASVPLFVVAIYATYTRCAWISLALGGAVVLGLSLRGRWRALVLGSLFGAALIVACLKWDGIMGIQREGGAVASRSSVDQRVSFTYVSWLMFLDRPLLGCGFGQYPYAVEPYLSDRTTSLELEALRSQPHHNTLLALMTETGLVGTALFVLVLAGWTRRAWRT